MTTTTPAPTPPSPPRRGLARPFVAFGVTVGVLAGLLVAAAAVLVLVSVASAETERTARSFPAPAALRIAADGGDVTIVGERRRDIRVEAEIRRNAWREDWKPAVAMQGRELRLGNDCSAWLWLGTGECGASYTVRVPRDTALALQDAGASDVRVTGVDRPLAIRTGSGDVEVHARRAPRSIRVETGSGDVSVTVPRARYHVAVDTGSGDEDVLLRDHPRSLRTIAVRTGSGDASVFDAGPAGRAR